MQRQKPMDDIVGAETETMLRTILTSLLLAAPAFAFAGTADAECVDAPLARDEPTTGTTLLASVGACLDASPDAEEPASGSASGALCTGDPARDGRLCVTNHATGRTRHTSDDGGTKAPQTEVCVAVAGNWQNPTACFGGWATHPDSSMAFLLIEISMSATDTSPQYKIAGRTDAFDCVATDGHSGLPTSVACTPKAPPVGFSKWTCPDVTLLASASGELRASAWCNASKVVTTGNLGPGKHAVHARGNLGDVSPAFVCQAADWSGAAAKKPYFVRCDEPGHEAATVSFDSG